MSQRPPRKDPPAPRDSAADRPHGPLGGLERVPDERSDRLRTPGIEDRPRGGDESTAHPPQATPGDQRRTPASGYPNENPKPRRTPPKGPGEGHPAESQNRPDGKPGHGNG
jgi:hypothetical protein